MSSLVVIHGTSGSGKSSVLDTLDRKSWPEDFGFVSVHPIGDLKQFLQRHYQCPNLNTQEGKKYSPAGANFGTMQDLMVKYWEWMKEEDPLFSCRYLEQRLSSLYFEGYSVCTCAIRNLPEVDVLIESKFETKLWINIERPGLDKPEISDTGVQDISLRAYKSGQFKTLDIVNNFKTVEDWQKFAVGVIMKTLQFEDTF